MKICSYHRDGGLYPCKNVGCVREGSIYREERKLRRVLKQLANALRPYNCGPQPKYMGNRASRQAHAVFVALKAFDKLPK